MGSWLLRYVSEVHVAAPNDCADEAVWQCEEPKPSMTGVEESNSQGIPLITCFMNGICTTLRHWIGAHPPMIVATPVSVTRVVIMISLVGVPRLTTEPERETGEHQESSLSLARSPALECLTGSHYRDSAHGGGDGGRVHATECSQLGRVGIANYVIGNG